MAPNGDVVKSEFVPPPIQHRLIETQDSVLRDARRRRRKFSQTIVDEDTLPLLDARQQMPQRESVPFASGAEHDSQIIRALLRSSVLEIESR
jgi:hypothetical protein